VVSWLISLGMDTERERFEENYQGSSGVAAIVAPGHGKTLAQPDCCADVPSGRAGQRQRHRIDHQPVPPTTGLVAENLPYHHASRVCRAGGERGASGTTTGTADL